MSEASDLDRKEHSHSGWTDCLRPGTPSFERSGLAADDRSAPSNNELNVMASISSRSCYRFIVLALLLLVYASNYIDRILVAVLAEDIKADLQLSDAQLGVLGGLAFAILYTTLSIPFAMLADRSSRTWVITICLSVWSIFTALCGVATSFWQILAFRMGVGIGEAGGVAPSYSIVSAYFPPDQRARALAFYSLGGPIGASSGYFLGGFVAEVADWRTAFIAVGLLGLLLAPIFRFVVREPAPQEVKEAPVPVSRVFSILARQPSFWLLSWGAAIASIPGYGVLFWLPSVMQRSYALPMEAASQIVGMLVLVAGVSGLLAGGWLSETSGKQDMAAYARRPGLALVAATPLFLVGLYVDQLWLALPLVAVGLAMFYAWIGPSLAIVQNMVSANMRSTAPACMLLIINLVGLGAGPWLVGLISDVLSPLSGSDALRQSLLATFPLFALGGLMLMAAARRLDLRAAAA